MRGSGIAEIAFLALLSAVAVVAPVRAQTATAVSADAPLPAVDVFMRSEQAADMLQSMSGVPAALSAELDPRFDKRAKPEVDRFARVLADNLRVNEALGALRVAFEPAAAADGAALVAAEDAIARQRIAWAEAEQRGEGADFMEALESRYEGQVDKARFEKLVRLRSSIRLAEENARATAVFTRLVETVLLDGPEELLQIPPADFEKGIATLYAAPDAEGGYSRIGTAREMEMARQRMLLMSLEPAQIDALLAFYEGPVGRSWSAALSENYHRQVRSITTRVALAYIGDVAKQAQN